MQIITIVEGKVPSLKANEFEANFALAKKEPLPPGLVSTSLLRNSKNPDVYKILTVWESMEALEKMRSSTSTPKAIALFQNIGGNPTLSIHELVDVVP